MITVVTPDHGERSYDADDWNTVNNSDGELWVGKEGMGVAQFAKGAWLFVYETKDPQPTIAVDKPKPRQWDSLYRTPWSVKVTDKDGDHYEARGSDWFWLERDRLLTYEEVKDISPMFGPFTEVIK